MQQMRRACMVSALFLAMGAAAQEQLWVENGEGLPGTSQVAVGVYATSASPMHAFSLALRYDIVALEFVGLDLDSSGVITGEVGYEYARTVHDDVQGHILAGVLLDLDAPYESQEIPASPEEPLLLGRLLFRVRPEADPGIYVVQPRNDLGSPPVDNVFSVYGQSVLPEINGATFTVLNPHHMYVKSTSAMAGGTALVDIQVSHADPVGGYTVVLRYPSDVLHLDTHPLDDPWDDGDFVADVCQWPITFCDLGLDRLLGKDGPNRQPIESFFAWAEADYPYGGTTPGVGAGWVRAAAIFDFVPPWRDQMLPPTTGDSRHSILRVRFTVAGTLSTGDTIPVTLVNGTLDAVSGTPVTNALIIPIPGSPAVSKWPDLHAGTITIIDGFRRGFINTDGQVDLGDIIALLQYLFTGGATPPCLKAADINDDGAVDIADGIYLLLYLFKGGPAPPPPFFECGPDPTPDMLPCGQPLGC